MKHSPYYWFVEIGQLTAIILFLASLMAGPAWLAWTTGIFLGVWFTAKYFMKPWL